MTIDPKRYRVDIINVDPYHAELDDMGDRSGILPFVLAEDYDREHELRLQAERERDELKHELHRKAGYIREPEPCVYKEGGPVGYFLGPIMFWTSGCGHDIGQDRPHWTYCPYCGGRIVIEESES